MESEEGGSLRRKRDVTAYEDVITLWYWKERQYLYLGGSLGCGGHNEIGERVRRRT